MPTRSIQMFLLALVSAGLFYFASEHWAHIFGLLPYLLFLACPVMHLFMHHHHHGTETKKQNAGSVRIG